jgi:hypothetical protein
MAAEVITTDDLREFKMELLQELESFIKRLAQKPTKRWLKSPQVKELMGISAGTLANLRVNGTLKFSKIGGIILYDYDHIVQVIEDCQIDNTIYR